MKLFHSVWRNKASRSLAVALASAVALPACADSFPDTQPPVEAGHQWKGPFLDFAAPNSDGWHLISHRPDLWTLGKYGSEPDESYVASVAELRLPAAISRDDFLALIQKKAEHDGSLSRFENAHYAVELSNARPYLCVQAHATADDTHARTSTGGTKSLFLELDGLYCQDPQHAGLGFAAIYSHRGGTADPQFEKEAADFIAGVEVPGH